jgi:GNAT superfamily N-acetyltransferase
MNNKEQIIKSMVRCWIFEKTNFFIGIPGQEVILEPDVIIKRSNIKSDTFNCVFYVNFSKETAEKRVRETIKIFKESDTPFTWWTCPCDTPENLPDILVKYGLKAKEKSLGMYLDLNYIKQEKFDNLSGLNIKRVLTKEDLFNFDQVHVISGGDKTTYEKLFSKLSLSLYQEGASTELYVGYCAEKPVATGMLVLYAGVAGIFYLVTVPEERKKGYGTLMMRFLLSRAKNLGYSHAVLQASVMGVNLYKRLGFKECCAFQEYGF